MSLCHYCVLLLTTRVLTANIPNCFLVVQRIALDNDSVCINCFLVRQYGYQMKVRLHQMVNIPTLTLNDGHPLPVMGLGTYQIRGGAGRQQILAAIKSGYRLIDSATNYDNEGIVGEAPCKFHKHPYSGCSADI